MSKPDDYLGKRYRNGESYYTVIGYIDQPALVMRDPITGEKLTQVIGCPNHLHMEEVSAEHALDIIEDRLRRMKAEATPPEQQ